MQAARLQLKESEAHRNGILLHLKKKQKKNRNIIGSWCVHHGWC